MKLAFNFTNGKQRIFTQEETDTIVKHLNYMKLIKFLMGDKNTSGATINILGQKISADDVRSIEFIL